MTFQIMSIIVWLLLVPFCCGLSLTRGLRTSQQSFSMIIVTGYFMMLAVFQCIYLGFVIFYNHFEVLVLTYQIVMLLLAAASLVINGKYWLTNRRVKERKNVATYLLWAVVLILIGFQCYKSVFFQFHDGDDAFYAATSVVTNTTNNMYVNLPYTGGTSSIDKRHAFSSAPILLSFLARVCRIHPAVVTHLIFPVIVLLLNYMIYKLIADILLENQKSYVPLFLIFINIMILFGNDTIYMDSTFLLTRTAQGKAFLANIIPAAAVLAMLLVWKTLEIKEGNEDKNKNGTTFVPWILLSCIMITAGYTSITGIVFVALPVGIAVLLFVFYYKKITLLVPCMLSMLPLLLSGLLYLKVLLGR